MTRYFFRVLVARSHDDAFSRTDAFSRVDVRVIIYDFDIVHLLMKYELNDNTV